MTIGRRWWGLTSALTLFLLHYTEAMRGELSLENVTILGTFAVTLCCLFAVRGHWLAAGVVVGLSLAFKPLLLVVLLLFVIAREWKALAAAVGIPAVLNGVAFLLVANPGQVWSKLPAVLNRVGPGVALNSAWVDVVRVFGWPDAASVLLRLVTVVLVLLAAWLAWTRVGDDAVRIITTTTMLLIGSYLAGTLSEYHFMLTLVPFAMTIVVARSPMRTVTAVVGIVWCMGVLVLPASWLGIAHDANHSAFRAFGMSLLLLSVIGVLARRRPVRETTASKGEGPAREEAPVEVGETALL
jgi:arabinofuranan 3-O-arabinosyltransferase